MRNNAMGSHTKRSREMTNANTHSATLSRGFTLIASLLMLLLLSGIAIGLLMMVNTEGKVGGTDLQNNVAYHAAEGGIETMASSLISTIQNAQAPSASDICNVGLPTTSGPALTGVSWNAYQATTGTLGATCPTALPTPIWGTITAGPNAGLAAQIIPVNMMATAAMSGGQEVSMTRQAQIALIPVFQFGEFSESSLAFIDTPSLTFKGSVHTNADLYLGVSSGANLIFTQKLAAYGNVIREQLPNGYAMSGSSFDNTGSVYIPTVAGGCGTSTTTNCSVMATPGTSGTCSSVGTCGDGSVLAGGTTTSQTGNYNASTSSGPWKAFSQSTNSMIINGNYGLSAPTYDVGTGATKLSMPFVGGGAGIQNYEVIRVPPTGESSTSAVAQSREYNLAQIRVLLSDDPNDLPGGSTDSNNIRLSNLTQAQLTAQGVSSPPTTGTNPYGITMTSGNYSATTFGTPSSGTYNLYFAAASNAIPAPGAVSASTTATSNGVLASTEWTYAPLAFAGAKSATPTQGLQPIGPTGGPNSPAFLGSSTSTAPNIILCPAVWNYTALDGTPTGCPTAKPSPDLSPYYLVTNSAAPTTAETAATVAAANTSAAWSLIDGYLRVEYSPGAGEAFVPVTMEWLKLGFARGVTPPTAPGTNPINPHAILLLQEPADRLLIGNQTDVTEASLTTTGGDPTCTTTSGSKCAAWTSVTQLLGDAPAYTAGLTQDWAYGLNPTSGNPTAQSVTQFNWYPINLYDAREGEVRDVQVNANSCTTNGLMNAVEIDVGNLKQWLAGTTGSSGTSVDYKAENGYILYFSDRRGMLLNPNATSSHPANTKSGDSGLEDVENPGTTAGTPNAALDSGEDVNANGLLDAWGTPNLGLGQWNGPGSNQNTLIVAANPDNPFLRMTYCATTGRKNWVSGARHVLKLVDGGLGNLPYSPSPVAVNGTNYYGGFTVASENPVYIQGNYNASSADTYFTTGVDIAGTPSHAAAAVIADAVSLLSGSWDDRNSMLQPPSIAYENRTASTTYYRLGIAGGKNMDFAYNANGLEFVFGTDGGVGNFLRLLEDWLNPPATLHYAGSLVSLYYATYGTGLFKCCSGAGGIGDNANAVYEPPNPRDYQFDTDFIVPAGLPPGTPMFKDVESLGYRQMFATRTF